MKNLYIEIGDDGFRYGYTISECHRLCWESLDMLDFATSKIDYTDIKRIHVDLVGNEFVNKIKSRIQDIPIGENVWGYSGVTLNKTILKVGQYHRNTKLTDKSHKILSYAYFPSVLIDINDRANIEAFPECIHNLILETGPIHYLHNLISNITLDSDQIKTLMMLLSSSDETNKVMGIPYLFMLNQPNYRHLLQFILEFNYGDIKLVGNSDSDLLLKFHDCYMYEYGSGYKAIKDFNELEQDLSRDLIIKYLTQIEVLNFVNNDY